MAAQYSLIKKSLSPYGGQVTPLIGPYRGQIDFAIGPHGGSIRDVFEASSSPPHGHLLVIPLHTRIQESDHGCY